MNLCTQWSGWTNRPFAQLQITRKLVAQSEADLAKGKISVDSPIGKGLLGKKVGDTAEISIPNGNVKFEILEIHNFYTKRFEKASDN